MPLEKHVFFNCDQPQSGDFQVISGLWSKMEVSLRQFSVSASKSLKYIIFIEIIMEYTCEPCKYATKDKRNYVRHLETPRHARNTVSSSFNLKTYQCDKCVKTFQTRAGKWKHEKNCDGNPVTSVNWKQGNAEQEFATKTDIDHLKGLLIDFIVQNKFDLTELKNNINAPSQQTNYNISGNNIVNNINLFLNTECKDAITLTEFIKNIQVPMEMTKNAGQLTYDGFIANVFRENIQRYALTERPIHCVDVKKEECHVKNDEGWTTDKGEGMNKIQDHIYKKQMNNLSSWSNEDTMTWKENEKTALLKANKTSFGPDDDEEFAKLKKKATRMCKESVLFV